MEYVCNLSMSSQGLLPSGAIKITEGKHWSQNGPQNGVSMDRRFYFIPYM